MKYFKKLKQRFVSWLIKIGLMKTNLFSILKNTKTGEYHIFNTYKDDNDKCLVPNPAKSCCNEVDFTDCKGEVLTCGTKKEARQKLVDIGDDACGTCASHLYKTPVKK